MDKGRTSCVYKAVRYFSVLFRGIPNNSCAYMILLNPLSTGAGKAACTDSATVEDKFPEE